MTLFGLIVNPSRSIPMQSLREALPGNLLARMQQELGQEETLRLLWPMVVGPELGLSTRLLAIRQNRLRVAVPDQTWRRTLASLQQAVLEAVHRVCGEEVGRSMDLVVDPTLAGIKPAKENPAARRSRSLAADLPPDLPDVPLDGIRDTELRWMFRRSARKYFARREETIR